MPEVDRKQIWLQIWIEHIEKRSMNTSLPFIPTNTDAGSTSHMINDVFILMILVTSFSSTEWMDIRSPDSLIYILYE